MTLNDYMRKNIFEPLAIKDMSMIPTAEMKARLAYMHHRSPDGALHPRDHLMRIPLVVSGDEETARCFHSGGGGLFARPQEYCSKSHSRSFILSNFPPPLNQLTIIFVYPAAGLVLSCARNRRKTLTWDPVDAFRNPGCSSQRRQVSHDWCRDSQA